MLENLALVVLIGLLAGMAARWLNPQSYPMGLPITLVIGVAGAVLGVIVSWMFWPPTEVSFQAGGLLLAILGALAMLWFYSARAGSRHGRF